MPTSVGGDRSPVAPAWPRRTALRRAAVTAAAAGFGGLGLAACASAVRSGTAPTAQSTILKVYYQINWQQSWNSLALRLCQEFTDTYFNSKHKGVMAIPAPWGNSQGAVTQIISGAPGAPAVLSSCCGDFFIARPVLANLTPLLRQDNLSSSLWSAGQLQTYQESSGLYGVPAYTACQPLIYNQTLFDTLGLPYPDPAWDYREAPAVWKSVSGPTKNGKHRYGTTFQWYPNYFDGSVFLLKGFGGEEMDPTHTICLMDSKAAITAGNWIYPLIWDKTMINRGGLGMEGAQAVLNGLTAMYQSAGNMLFEAVNVLGTNIKWDVLPMPSWPVRRATNVQVDFYGVNAHYKNQELAWELFKFVAASTETNRFLIRSTLSFPNLVSMWSEWESIVRAVAPMTQHKQLKWWRIAAEQGYGYGHEFWRYLDPQAQSIMGAGISKIWNQKISVQGGYTQIAQQVTAFEKTAERATQRQNAVSSLFPTRGPDVAPVATGL